MLARAAGKSVERIDAERLQARLGNAVHQGVAAEVSQLAPWREDDLLRGAAAGVEPAAAGARRRPGSAQSRRLPAHRRCLWRAGAGRAAGSCRLAECDARARVPSGAAETTPVVMVTNLARTLRLLKQAGLWIVGADADAPQRASGGRSDRAAGAWSWGRRVRGCGQLTRRHCDWLVRLPSRGAVESLNVSVATRHDAVRGAAAARLAEKTAESPNADKSDA